MESKPLIKLLGTLLLLFGIFGYLFPTIPGLTFTTRENELHALTGLLVLILASLEGYYRRISLVLMALFYLALGIYGFSLTQSTLTVRPGITLELSRVDTIIHLLFGLAFSWTWLKARRTPR